MKKIAILFFFACFLAVSVNLKAQSNNIETLAKQAARDAGCLDGYHGPLDYTINFLGGCACGPATTCAWQEVYVYARQNPNSPARVGAFAKVTFCGDQVLSVECILEP